MTFTSLPEVEENALGGAGMFQAKFYGLGADGTVGANKNSVKIIGDKGGPRDYRVSRGGFPDKYCQAYFSYDSKKSGGFICSHLRFGDTPIRSTNLVTTPRSNLFASLFEELRGLPRSCVLSVASDHSRAQAYLHMYDVTRGLQKGGAAKLSSVSWRAPRSVPAEHHLRRRRAREVLRRAKRQADYLDERSGKAERMPNKVNRYFARLSGAPIIS